MEANLEANVETNLEMNMKIDRSTVIKLVISNVPGLDPLHVFLEDIAPGRGRITITCYRQSWTAAWGAMGGRTLAEFFCDCGADYLAGNLSNTKEWVYDADACEAMVKTAILRQRRHREIDQVEAREWYDDAERGFDDPYDDPERLQRLFGDEWWCHLPEKTNPDYAWLIRIIETVQQALKRESLAAA